MRSTPHDEALAFIEALPAPTGHVRVNRSTRFSYEIQRITIDVEDHCVCCILGYAITLDRDDVVGFPSPDTAEFYLPINFEAAEIIAAANDHEDEYPIIRSAIERKVGLTEGETT